MPTNSAEHLSPIPSKTRLNPAGIIAILSIFKMAGIRGSEASMRGYRITKDGPNLLTYDAARKE